MFRLTVVALGIIPTKSSTLLKQKHGMIVIEIAAVRVYFPAFLTLTHGPLLDAVAVWLVRPPNGIHSTHYYVASQRLAKV